MLSKTEMLYILDLMFEYISKKNNKIEIKNISLKGIYFFVWLSHGKKLICNQQAAGSCSIISTAL
jgi:hypothetical protein